MSNYFNASHADRFRWNPSDNQWNSLKTQLTLHLTQELSRHLDLYQLLDMSLQHTKEMLDVCGIAFKPTDRTHQFHLANVGCESIYHLPCEIHNDDYTVGSLMFYSHEPISDLKANLLEVVARVLITPITNAITYMQALALAKTDALTQLGNRRHLDESLRKIVAQSCRHNLITSLMIIDIDHFKKINDNYGHQVGDQVIQSIADSIRDVARETDLSFRMGGEEFVVVMQNTNLDGAEKLAERLRESISRKNHHQLIEQITVSIGVAQLDYAEDNALLIARADQALYKAKSNGRNMVQTNKVANCHLKVVSNQKRLQLA